MHSVLYAIIILELLAIVYLRVRLGLHAKTKNHSACGMCLQIGAYERLQERKRIISLVHRHYEVIPSQCYVSERKRAIAELACRKLYIILKDSLEHI